MTLQELEQLAAPRNDAGCAECRTRQAVAHQAAVELRRFIAAGDESRPTGTLFDAVEAAVADARRAGTMEIELSVGPTDGSVRGDGLAALLGALREALANARKHSRADRLTVYLEERNEWATIRVRDYGIGATPSQLRAGFGIAHSIFGRMHSSGGAARVERTEQGLIVTLVLGPSGSQS